MSIESRQPSPARAFTARDLLDSRSKRTEDKLVNKIIKQFNDSLALRRRGNALITDIELDSMQSTIDVREPVATASLPQERALTDNQR